MLNDKIIDLIKAEFNDAEIEIEGDGYHYQLNVTSHSFAGLNKVKRQQLVYKALHLIITSGDLHAISLQTFTPDEKVSA